MAERQPYPWQNGKDNIVAQLESIPGPDASIQLPTYPWPLILLSGSTCGLALLWIITQFILIQPGYTVNVPESLTKLPRAERLEILPTPTRYDFLSALSMADNMPDSVPEAQNPQAPALSISPAIPVTPTFTPPVQENTPTTTIQLAPPPPIEPQFSLVGIAQGADGNVANIKVTQNNAMETKDVRLGEPLMPGYMVTRIEDEFVLVKAQKNGKVIRVD